MSRCLRVLCCLVSSFCLLSCGAEKTPQRAQISCPSIRLGGRIGEQPVHGIIFDSVGEKIELRSCPGVQLHFAFIGDEPADYRRLAQLAEKRVQVVGFNALADGYVVDDRNPTDDQRPGTAESYLVLLDGLEHLREDPAVAARFEQLAHEKTR